MCSACESKSRLHANSQASKGIALVLSVSSSDLGVSRLAQSQLGCRVSHSHLLRLPSHLQSLDLWRMQKD